MNHEVFQKDHYYHFDFHQLQEVHQNYQNLTATVRMNTVGLDLIMMLQT